MGNWQWEYNITSLYTMSNFSDSFHPCHFKHNPLKQQSCIRIPESIQVNVTLWLMVSLSVSLPWPQAPCGTHYYLIIHEGHLKVHQLTLLPWVRTLWRCSDGSLFWSTSLGKWCTSYNAPSTSRKHEWSNNVSPWTFQTALVVALPS
jgi:hypothetical protein